MHNFSDRPRQVDLDVGVPAGRTLVNLIDPGESRADESGMHHIELPALGYRWLRVGSADSALDRQAR